MVTSSPRTRNVLEATALVIDNMIGSAVVNGRHHRQETAMKIVVGADGAEGSQRAVAWCAKCAAAMGAEVIAVHALEVPVYAWRLDAFAPPLYSEEDHEKLREDLSDQWCAQLASANLPFQAVVPDGYPATVIIEPAYREQADLVVTGRRGLAGFKEMLPGSTSSHLSHHLTLPLVIVP